MKPKVLKNGQTFNFSSERKEVQLLVRPTGTETQGKNSSFLNQEFKLCTPCILWCDLLNNF